MKKIFITGTDTSVGKTYVSVSLINQFNNRSFSTFGIKPIASGCESNKTGNLINEDALALQKAASIKKDYSIVNPIALKDPIAPHLAAENANITLSTSIIKANISNSIQRDADINIIEGAGGWFVPINNNELISDVICSLNIPVILVVGIKLGCINHAILTSRAIIQARIPFIGWVANCVDSNTLACGDNIQTLQKWIPAPCLGVMPYQPHPNIDDENINIDLILEHFI